MEKRTKSTDFMLEKRTKLFLASLALGVLTATASADALGSNESGHLVINEIMQSNVECLMVDNDYPDSWVELYNPSEVEVSLGGYSIGEHADGTDAWPLENSASIPAWGHLVIYCDKKAEGLNTDFRLDSGKGELYLFDAGGRIIDQLIYEKMPAPNIAFGRMNDGSEAWHYELQPTPGTANVGQGTSDVALDPVFSLEGGIMSNPFTLIVTLPDEDCPSDASIYWTTDGSEPGIQSAHAKEVTLNIDHSMVVRAKILSQEYLPARSVTHSYIFPPRELKMPVFSLATDNDYLYDDIIGILAGAEDDPNANYMQSWRRPLNVECFVSDSTALNQLCETSVGGKTSRVYRQKSLRLYAHKRFGTKRFKYPFWFEKPDVEKNSSLMLRNGGSRSFGSRTNDAFVQQLFGTHVTDLDWQAYRPVIVYINGEYKGVFELRERSDEHYVEANFGIDDNDIYQTDNLFYGEGTFDNLVSLIWDKSPSFEAIGKLMDISEFVNYLIAEAYCGNRDWPGNNIFAWAPKSEGGRWRWILKDLDEYRFYSNEKNFLNYMFVKGQEGEDVKKKDNEKGHKFFTTLFSFEQFRSMFVNRFSAYLGDFLKPSVACDMLTEIRNEIEDEMRYTFDAYSSSGTYNWYKYEQNAMLDYTKERAAAMYRNLSETFSLGKVVPAVIETKGVKVSLNGVMLKAGDFDGAFFHDWVSTVESEEITEGWMLSLLLLDGTKKNYHIPSSAVHIDLRDYPECDSVFLKPFSSSDSSIYVFEQVPVAEDVYCYDLCGRRVSHPETRQITIYKRKKIVITETR